MAEKTQGKKVVFDASGAVAGRLAAVAAKKALSGDQVAIVNCEKAVLTGNPVTTVAKYEGRRGIQQKSNPEESAKWPRRPDLLFKRIIKGMLPKKKASGKAALHRVMVFVGVPQELEAAKKEVAGMRPLRSKGISMLELCKQLGWKTTLN